MGLNLYVYQVTLGYDDKVLSKKMYKDWDSARYSGDKEFDRSELPKEYAHDEDEMYWRPNAIDEWEEWVRKSIFEANQERLLNILNTMKSQRDLYFYSSY